MLNLFGSPGQFSARQKDNAFAGQAFQANISPHPDDLPAKSPAGMCLAQCDDVV